MKYAFMLQHERAFTVTGMARVLEVRRNAYYAWKARRANPKPARHPDLDQRVAALFKANKERYGAPRITEELRSEGKIISKKTVAKSLQRQDLKAKAKRKYKATTNSKHDLPVAPNRLAQDFSASAPDQKWVSDITYIRTREGWLYLCVVMDLYSRLIVGWSMRERLVQELAIDALTMAIWNRQPTPGLIFHSDRGVQYAAGAFQTLLKAQKMLPSMSKKGDCYDNAAMESWNHTLKVEHVNDHDYLTRAEARQSVFEYIYWYNRERRHSTLNYLSPEAFEAMRLVA